MKLEICLSPVLYPFYQQDGDTVVVVDIFRASTTICAMLNNGASSVIPVAGIEEALRYKTQGFLVGGERNARKIDFADFGNSPFDYKKEIVENKVVVFTTTNGTQAIEAAKECSHLMVGAFSNIDKVAEKCIEFNGRVVVLCAGWKNKVNIEDTLFGGAFAERLSSETEITFESDAVKLALELWKLAKKDPLEFVESSDHYKRLVANGAEGDVPFCLTKNTTLVVPEYDVMEKKLRID